MQLLEAGLLTRLKKSRLLPRKAFATSGIGERSSRSKGSGLEFEDYRTYQQGDDIRHLDPHVYSRLGIHAIRQFAQSQQMHVTVLLDCSKSMSFGAPSKHLMATQLAAMVAYVSVAGGDRVRVGAISDGQLRWFPVRSSIRQTSELFLWLKDLRPGGPTNLGQLARASMPRLRPGGMLVVISDWLSPDYQDGLAIWRTARQELVGLQTLTPEELEPDRLGGGPSSLLDSETGTHLEINLDQTSRASYTDLLDKWITSLQAELHAASGRHFLINSHSDLNRDVLAEWRRSGFVI